MSHAWCFFAILSRRNLSLASLLFNSATGRRLVLEKGRHRRLLACLVSPSLVLAFSRQHCCTVNLPEKGFYGLEWPKNTTHDSINISLKLYFNLKVKGDLKYLHSVKISTDRVARIKSFKFQTEITPHKQRVVGLWLVPFLSKLSEKGRTVGSFQTQCVNSMRHNHIKMLQCYSVTLLNRATKWSKMKHFFFILECHRVGSCTSLPVLQLSTSMRNNGRQV